MADEISSGPPVPPPIPNWGVSSDNEEFTSGIPQPPPNPLAFVSSDDVSGIPPPPPMPPVFGTTDVSGIPPPPPIPPGGIAMQQVPEGFKLRSGTSYQPPKKAPAKKSSGGGLSLEDIANAAKQKQSKIKCPTYDGDRELGDKYKKYILDKDNNAFFLVSKGYNPVDVALMSRSERASLVNDWKDGKVTNPVCEAPEKRRKKDFGYSIADACYPADPEDAQFKTLEECDDERKVDQINTNINKYIDAAYGQGSVENFTVSNAYASLTTKEKLEMWDQLKALGILTLNKQEKSAVKVISPDAQKQINDLQKQMTDPNLNKNQKKQLENKVEDIKAKNTKFEERIKEVADEKGRKLIAKRFFDKKYFPESDGGEVSDSDDLKLQLAMKNVEIDALKKQLASGGIQVASTTVERPVEKIVHVSKPMTLKEQIENIIEELDTNTLPTVLDEATVLKEKLIFLLGSSITESEESPQVRESIYQSTRDESDTMPVKKKTLESIKPHRPNEPVYFTNSPYFYQGIPIYFSFSK